jgi:hypothetical protein
MFIIYIFILAKDNKQLKAFTTNVAALDFMVSFLAS